MQHTSIISVIGTLIMQLSRQEEAALAGEEGYALQLAYRILVATGEATDADRLAPAAMVCQKADLMVASGCAMSSIPLLVANEDELKVLKDGLAVSVDTKSSSPVTFV